ncbi:MAG: efflux RND transporter periplasmic adaptor subunit [Candidatus Rokuibacteriota bacterium]
MDDMIGGGDRSGRGRVFRGLGMVALVGLAFAGGYLVGERKASSHRNGSPPAPIQPAPLPSASPRPAVDEAVEVTLTREAIERAGIKTAAARSRALTATVSVPATVTSNAYRDTKVNALVGGIVRGVAAELGAAVSAGQPLAVVFSSELADAQTRYLSMRAMLAADHQKRERTAKLVAIGAASLQELEEVTAVHDAHETEVAAARQRLLLLGLSPERVAALRAAADVVSEVTVAAPAPGVVVARSVNVGQVVAVGQEMFVVADLGTVWVIADLYEKDFDAVRVGSEATVTVPHAAAVRLRGRVAYIDPRVDPAARTAKVRVEIPNREGALRLGMFVNVAFAVPASGRSVLVPRSAVQSIGERAVVYVAARDDEGRFVERPVRLGVADGDLVQVVDGLAAGERVVTEGSFFVRAEAARTRAGG